MGELPPQLLTLLKKLDDELLASRALGPSKNNPSEKIICYYQRPSLRLSFLCLVQRSLPLLSAVVLCLGPLQRQCQQP
jgi:hypothetical protein